jgi:hypothetical protein
MDFVLMMDLYVMAAVTKTRPSLRAYPKGKYQMN